jgi:aerobic-type carbon monoxide dehydrogenase small subunit (CoxS/CutS family)
VTTHRITLDVDGERHAFEVEARRLLSDVLRDLGRTGVHVGCEHGVCGACTVQVDGAPMRACLLFAVQLEGHAIRTVADLGANGGLDRLQQAFHDAHGLQCGFCTPGLLMTLDALLRERAELDEAAIREVVSGHLCRCTGYDNIVKAVQLALRRRAGTA